MRLGTTSLAVVRADRGRALQELARKNVSRTVLPPKRSPRERRLSSVFQARFSRVVSCSALPLDASASPAKFRGPCSAVRLGSISSLRGEMLPPLMRHRGSIGRSLGFSVGAQASGIGEFRGETALLGRDLVFPEFLRQENLRGFGPVIGYPLGVPGCRAACRPLRALRGPSSKQRLADEII